MSDYKLENPRELAPWETPWDAKIQELEAERDRLRVLLEQIAGLKDAAGDDYNPEYYWALSLAGDIARQAIESVTNTAT